MGPQIPEDSHFRTLMMVSLFLQNLRCSISFSCGRPHIQPHAAWRACVHPQPGLIYFNIAESWQAQLQRCVRCARFDIT